MKCMDQIAMPKVMLPAAIHSVAARPVLSRILCAWVSAVNEPIMATSTDRKTSEAFQEIGKAVFCVVYIVSNAKPKSEVREQRAKCCLLRYCENKKVVHIREMMAKAGSQFAHPVAFFRASCGIALKN